MLHMLADPEVTQEGSVEALFSYPVCVSLDILGPERQILSGESQILQKPQHTGG